MKLKNLMLATALTMGATSTIATSTMFLTTTKADAFGLSDITGAAKKVGGAVKKGVKKGAKAVGKGGEAVGKAGLKAAKVARDTRDVTLNVGMEVFTAVPWAVTEVGLKAVGKFDEEIARKAKHDLNTFYSRAARKLDRAIGKGLSKAAGGINHVIRNKGGTKIGESLKPIPKNPSLADQLLLKQGLKDFANGNRITRQNKIARRINGTARIGLVQNRPVGNTMISLDGKKVKRHPIGITKEHLGIRGNRKPIGRDKSVWGRPVGNIKHVGRDKSRWGRPVGNVKIGIVRDKSGKRFSKRRPLGITKDNLRQTKDIKFKRTAKLKDKIQRRGFKKKTLKLYKKDKRFNKFKLRKLRKKQVQKYFKKRFRKKSFNNKRKRQRFSRNSNRRKGRGSRNR